LRFLASIWIVLVLTALSQGAAGQAVVYSAASFDFYGESIRLEGGTGIRYTGTLSVDRIDQFFGAARTAGADAVADAVCAYKTAHHPDDWVYYQLIRKTAGALCPKATDYTGYTLYKCYLLGASGYDVALKIVDNKLLLYVRSDADLYDIPTFTRDGKKYICLNYHDYGYAVDFERALAVCVVPNIPGAVGSFSYAVNKLPQFPTSSYRERALSFPFRGKRQRLTVRLTDDVKAMFSNYPVAAYAQHFNLPLSAETYGTLIPQLREKVGGMTERRGVEFLMCFTRYAFSYAPDTEHFGREKRLSPEQTLLYDRSDCEDRAALFYYLVKEIYNLPMLVITFPEHVAVAVKLEKPAGRQIVHKGVSYSVCEPTPQGYALPVGALPAHLERAPYEVAYAYEPEGK